MQRKLLSLLLILAMMLPLGLALAEPAPLTVTVFAGDPFDQPTSDNKIYKLIEEEFGIKFEFEFLAGDLDETLGIKIAGQDYADIMSGSNSAEMLIDAGTYIDLLDYINETDTPNLWAHFEPYMNRITVDGGLYVMPSFGRIYNDAIVNYQNGPAFWIQKKVLAWDNYPTITTPEQYFDLLLRYKEAHPTTEDGLPTSGFEILTDGWRNFCLLNPVQHLMGHPNDGGVFVHWDDNYRVDVFHNKDYSKPYYQKLNEVFQKGLIDQDTFVQNFDQYIAKLSSGRVLGMFDQYWNFQNATDALIARQMYGETYIGLPLVYSEDITDHYIDQPVINVNRGFGISVNCKEPKRIVDMFEALLDDRWQTIFHWGIEGEDYYVENGRYLRTAEQKANAENPVWVNANKARALFFYSPKKEGTMDNGNSWDPALQPELYFDMMSEYDKEFLTSYGMKTPAEFFTPAPPNEPYYPVWQIDLQPYPDMRDINTQMGDIQARDLPRLIMAAPGEFDGMWETFAKTMSDAGQAEYEVFLQGIILEMNERLR
ncbi:MAG: extracellular solute-binding protein [Clostridiales bacterium]|nr:extracellular solute-binding protein [Clostridiales bacterium]